MGTDCQDNYALCGNWPREMEALDNGQNNALYGCVNIFPQPPRCLVNDPMSKVALLAGMEDMHEVKNIDFPLPSLT